VIVIVQVIILSSMQYHVDKEQWHNFYRPLWLAAALLNSCYSYFWDIERDWEIQFFSSASELLPCSRLGLRSYPGYDRACGVHTFGSMLHQLRIFGTAGDLSRVQRAPACCKNLSSCSHPLS
jgi:hypothetical protein